jgi:cyclopropane fatty-acyl-phospholipid synthase-like methyltransferase
LPAEFDDRPERELIGELLDVCGFDGLNHVVDYGCGRGRWIWPLCARCQHVTGVDCEQSYLDTIAQIAAANGLDTVQVINAPDLRAIPDSSVDGIISIGTLPVVRQGDLWHDFFEQAARALRPGGRILFNTFAPELVMDQLTSFEGLRYIRSHGVWFAIDRQIGWIMQWLRSFRASIERGKRYYAVPRAAVAQLIEAKGFRIVMGPDDVLAKSRIASLPAYANPDRTRPHYLWWLVTR